MTEKNVRISYFDNLKFLLVALVVIGHMADPFIKSFHEFAWLYYFIYTFHMPLLIFVMGLFSKSIFDENGRYDIMKPIFYIGFYIVFNFAIYAIQRWLQDMTVEFMPWTVVNVSWFMLASAIYFIIVPLFVRGNLSVLISISVLVALLAGYVIVIEDVFAFSRVLCFTPFFIAGFRLDADRIVERIMRVGIRRKIIAGVFIAAVFLAVCLAGKYTDIVSDTRGILTARNPYDLLGDNAAFGAVIRLMWYGLAILMSFSVMCVVPMRKSFISRLGRNTMALYFWHAIALRILGVMGFVIWVSDLSFSDYIAMLIPIAVALVIIIVFSLKPPFGMIIGRLTRIKLFIKINRRWQVIFSVLVLIFMTVGSFLWSEV